MVNVEEGKIKAGALREPATPGRRLLRGNRLL